MQLHAAAGGPATAPIYASIDDDPSYDQYKQQIAPYLRSWESVIGHQRTGVYANSKTIDWALHDGLGSYFWQHNWGSPKGFTHPAAHLHQVEIDKRSVGGRRGGHQRNPQAAIRAVGLDSRLLRRSPAPRHSQKIPANTRSLVFRRGGRGRRPAGAIEAGSARPDGRKFLHNDYITILP